MVELARWHSRNESASDAAHMVAHAPSVNRSTRALRKASPSKLNVEHHFVELDGQIPSTEPLCTLAAAPSISAFAAGDSTALPVVKCTVTDCATS